MAVSLWRALPVFNVEASRCPADLRASAAL